MAKRMNRTLVEMKRCMLSEAHMNKTYQCEAMLTTVDIGNVLPSASSPNSSPFDMVFKHKPRLGLLWVFGSLCYAHIDKTNLNKLDEPGLRCQFLA